MADSKSETAQGRAARKEAKNAAAIALRNRRNEQMQTARLATRRLRDATRPLKKLSLQRQGLASHLEGFYAEVDKLAKGRTMLEVTPLILDQANEIIRDAKAIVTGDVYLDRIKEFVPAGNNPVYPDVLVVMRGVQHGLHRAKESFDNRGNRIRNRLIKAETVATALEIYFERDDPDDLPTKENVRAIIENVERYCFYEADDGEEYFDFDFLDSKNLNDFFSEDVDEDDVSEEAKQEDQDSNDGLLDENDSKENEE